MHDDAEYVTAARTFVRRSMNQKILSREEEVELLTRWKEQHDQQARGRIVEAHMRLVVSQAAKFRGYGLPLSDLMQEGNLGLLHATEKFDLSKEVRFSTYAAWWVKSFMQDYILRNWSIVRCSTTSAQKALFFNLRRLRAKCEDASGTSLNDAGRKQIAATLGISIKDVTDAEVRLGVPDQSLSFAYSHNGEEGDSLQDSLADERPSPEERLSQTGVEQRQRHWLADALARLAPREQHIIVRRRLHDTDDTVTLEDLGKELGVSKERVRQVENRALEKIRTHLDAMAMQRGGTAREMLLA